MTKAEYLSNSAKLFTIGSILLFITNLCLLLGEYNTKIGSYGEMLSDYSFYIVFLLAALSLNGEGIGYKRHRDYVNKKRIGYIKFILAFAIIMRFIKGLVESFFLNLAQEGSIAIAVKVFLGALNTVATYGFLFTVLSFFYMLRDVTEKKLFLVETSAFIMGVIYAVFRSIYYAVTKYSLVNSGNPIADFFAQSSILYIISIVQYLFFVMMCIYVMTYYSRKVLDEHDALIKERKNMLTAPKIYNTDLVGIDTLEDEYLLSPVDDNDY